jgi:hypothetical protein
MGPRFFMVPFGDLNKASPYEARIITLNLKNINLKTNCKVKWFLC